MNWGLKLTIGMALFMIFITSLVAIMIIRHEDDALIDNDYYEKGQSFDKEYQAKQNAIDDQVIPTIVVNNGVVIRFPISVKYQLICKRSSDSKMDKSFKGSTDDSRSIKISRGELQPGPWRLSIQYSTGDKNYLFETEIVMP